MAPTCRRRLFVASELGPPRLGPSRLRPALFVAWVSRIVEPAAPRLN
jgi:hypothetical protein